MSVDPSGFWHPPATVHPSQLHAPIPPGYACRDPIPTFTTQTPSELLEKHYIDRRNDPDWTDPNGVLSKQMEVYRHYPHNAAAPIGSPGLIGKWPRPNGLAAVPVPVHGVEFAGPHLVVEFRNLDLECPSTGIPLADLYEENTDILEGAEDILAGGSRKRDLKFDIAWPGYQLQRHTIGLAADNGGPLTRFELGRKIAMTYALLFRQVEMERLLPSHVGFYNIALHQGQSARWDSLGVQLMQLHLVRLRGTVGGGWVADVDIV